MMYLCCILDGEEYLQKIFHMSKAIAIRFWEAFAQVYFDKDRSLEDIAEEIKPYAGLKTIIIERDSGKPMTEFRKALKGIL